MKTKKWLLISLTTLSVILFLNFLFLYLTDFYGVMNPTNKRQHSGYQQRFVVVEYMLKNLNKYDTLLFGSSRVQFINPFHIKDKKVYNMTVAEGIPHEYLIMLKLFLKKGMNLKNLIIVLDDFSYQVSFASHQNIPDTKSHYLTTGISKFDFYKTYYFRKLNKKDYLHIKNIYNDTNPFARHYSIIFNQKEAFNSNYAEYKQPKPNHPIYNIPTLYDGNEIKDTIKDIKDIVNICEEHNIKLTVFINPMHHTTYKNSNLKRLEEFKDKLTYVTPYYDFTKPNRISNDNNYWLETSHYMPEVGDMILSRIYDNNTTIKDFGIYQNKKENN